MEEVYTLHQHKYRAVICFTKVRVRIKFFGTNLRKVFSLIGELSKDACITYNKQTQKVLSWGDASFETKDDEFGIKFDGFMDGLYELFEKEKQTRNEKDLLLIGAVSDFIILAMNELMEYENIENKSLDSFHYAFVVPSEWEEEIRDDLIRPIFIQGGLLSKDDHKDRLIFISDLECICYSSHYKDGFKRGQNTVICRFASIDDSTALIKLDLVTTTNTLFNFPNSMLFPKVNKSSAFYINFNNIRNSIKFFWKEKLSIDNDDIDQDEIVQEIIQWMYNIMSSDKFYENLFFDEDTHNQKIKTLLYEPFTPNITRRVLNNSQKIVLKSICCFNIMSAVGKQITDNIKNLLSNSFIKEYKILYCEYNPFSDIELDDTQNWLFEFMFRCSILDLNNITTLSLIKFNRFKVDDESIIDSASDMIEEVIQNSEMHSTPGIIPTEKQMVSSSIFLNSKPDVIINIDILFKSTVISYSILKEDGSIKEPFDQTYFVADKCLPSLKTFYDISNSVSLKLGENFISFADKYLLGDSSFFCTDREFLSEVEKIMNKDYSSEKIVSFIHLHKYIEALFLMYLIYIKTLISNKLPNHVKLKNRDIKIGYAISIEKFLLNEIIGNKEDLQQLVYKSCLIDKNDNNSKLRIITQGEGIFSIIQTVFELNFPVKSYFVLAQLHEDYIQLTLNQVVTKSNLEDKQQESIIVEDKIIPTQNIFESLCLNMWNNLMENSSFIKLCHIHSKSGNDHKTLDLFTSKSKNTFMENLKEYILNNILNSDYKLENIRESIISLNQSCNCKIHIKANDIINICFKPILQKIHATMMFSLINKEIFGKYNYIDYLFSLIHFNNNPHFEKIISTIFNEETYYYNPERGIDTSLMVIPKTQKTVHKMHSFIYKGFTIGTLRQIHNTNYGIKFGPTAAATKLFSVYKHKRVDTKAIDVLADKLFPVLNKEDFLGDIELNYVLYLKPLETEYHVINIDLSSYENFDILQNDEATLIETAMEYGYIDGFGFDCRPNIESVLPIVITVKSLGYSSSICISAREAGQDTTENNLKEIGNPMILYRS